MLELALDRDGVEALAHAVERADRPHPVLPLHLVGVNQRGTVVPRNRPGFGTGSNPVDVRMYQAIRAMQTGNHGPWHGAVGQAFVDQLDLASTLAAHYPDDDALPDSDIVASLEIAARMINANLGFRVLTAGWGDFDSHANQPGMHTSRMEELNAAQSRLSFHLRTLKDAGLVKDRRDGRWNYYSLDGEAFEDLEALIQQVKSGDRLKLMSGRQCL